MALDIYRPQTMLRIAQTIKEPRTFLKDLFFRRVETFSTMSVTFDVREKDHQMAQFVASDIGQSLSARAGFKTKQFTPPLVAPARAVTADDVDRRVLGENVFGGRTPNQRRASLLRQDMLDLDREITRLEEFMAAKAMVEGKIHVKGEGVDEIIDFHFENHVVVGRPWTDADAKPFDDLQTAVSKASESGHTPNVLIANGKTIQAFLNNTQVQKFLDNSGLRIGIIEPQIVRNGASYQGFLRQSGLDVYSYDGAYRQDGKFVKHIPDGKVIIASTDAPNLMLYGVIHNERNGSQAGSRVPNTYFSDNGSTRFISLSSRPLPVPVDVTSWIVLDVFS